MKNDTNNKICCFVQARLSSTRLYSKVLKKINNSTFIDLIYSKCKDKTYDLVFLIPSNEKERAKSGFICCRYPDDGFFVFYPFLALLYNI